MPVCLRAFETSLHFSIIHLRLPCVCATVLGGPRVGLDAGRDVQCGGLPKQPCVPRPRHRRCRRSRTAHARELHVDVGGATHRLLRSAVHRRLQLLSRVRCVAGVWPVYRRAHSLLPLSPSACSADDASDVFLSTDETEVRTCRRRRAVRCTHADAVVRCCRRLPLGSPSLLPTRRWTTSTGRTSQSSARPPCR